MTIKTPRTESAGNAVLCRGLRRSGGLIQPLRNGALSAAARGGLLVFALVLLLLLPGCKPKELQALLEPSRALASVLADESLRAAGSKKKVALITHDNSWGPPSSVENAFRAALKERGLAVTAVKAANPGNPMSGEVGLKAGDFIEALEKSTGAGCIVSLIGAPLLKDGEATRLPAEHPPVLVVATASLGDKLGVRSEPIQLARLLEAKVIHLAIVDGAEPSAQPPGKPNPVHDLFSQHYRILRRPD